MAQGYIVAAVMRWPWIVLLLAACSSRGETAADPVSSDPAAANTAATNPAAASLDIPADAPLVVFLGDSISAGLHLAESDAFPAVIQRRLHAKGQKFRLVNAGSSGDTSAGGLRRIDWLLRQQPTVVVVELGGNDGLRGQKIETIRDNLARILARIRSAGARALLLGMRIPTNYGADYTAAFAKIYDDLARAVPSVQPVQPVQPAKAGGAKNSHQVAYVPFFMAEIAGQPELFLADGLHPNAQGHRILAKKVAPALAALLR